MYCFRAFHYGYINILFHMPPLLICINGNLPPTKLKLINQKRILKLPITPFSIHNVIKSTLISLSISRANRIKISQDQFVTSTNA